MPLRAVRTAASWGRTSWLVNGTAAVLGDRFAGLRVGRLDGELLASRRRRSRPRLRFARPGVHQAHPVCRPDLYLASQTPSFAVAPSASSVAASAWIGIRPPATSWPPDRRPAEPNGAA